MKSGNVTFSMAIDIKKLEKKGIDDTVKEWHRKVHQMSRSNVIL